jgi:ferredoxin
MLRVDRRHCDQCGTCISVCPTDALVLLAKLQVREDNCISCGKCVAICPFGALRLSTASEDSNE